MDTQRYGALEKQNRSLNELVKEQEVTIKRLQQEKEQNDNKVYDQQAEITQLKQRVGNIPINNDHATGNRAEVEQLTERCNMLETQLRELYTSASTQRDTIETLHSEIREIRNAKEGGERQILLLTQQLGVVGKQVQDSKQQQTQLSLSNSSDLSKTKNILDERERQNAELQKHIVQLQAAKQDLQGQVNELQYKVKQAQSKDASNSPPPPYGAQDLQRQKMEFESRLRTLTDQNIQMRSEIEYAIKLLNTTRHNTNGAFLDNVFSTFKSLSLPPPSPTATSVNTPPQSPSTFSAPSYSGSPSTYPPSYSAGSAYTNPPYYPQTTTPYPTSNTYASPSSPYTATNSFLQYPQYSQHQQQSGGSAGYPYQGGSTGGIGGSGIGAGIGAGLNSMRLSGGGSAPVHTPTFTIPAFCARNSQDLPDIIEELTEAGKGSKPILKFKLEDYAKVPNGGNGRLAVVLAMCGTDRVDITDKELLDNLRETKGYTDVLMIVLRRGNEPSKFKAYHDPSINSGVDKEKQLFQLLYFKGKLVEAECNTATMAKFLDLAKKAFPAC